MELVEAAGGLDGDLSRLAHADPHPFGGLLGRGRLGPAAGVGHALRRIGVGQAQVLAVDHQGVGAQHPHAVAQAPGGRIDDGGSGALLAGGQAGDEQATER
jgi:hypothetical protein